MYASFNRSIRLSQLTDVSLLQQCVILSLTDDQMLVASYLSNEVYKYSTNGTYVSTIPLSPFNRIIDAALIELNRIVLVMWFGGVLVLTTKSTGNYNFVQERLMKPLALLSVTSNGVIYAGVESDCVLTSLDKGLTWSNVSFLQPRNNWYSYQAVNVKQNVFNDYWTLQMNKSPATSKHEVQVRLYRNPTVHEASTSDIFAYSYSNATC